MKFHFIIKLYRYITSNVNRHLREQHGIITEASEKQANKLVAENQYRHELAQAFKNNMSRLGELQWVLMMILCRLPTAFGSYKVVKDTMALTGIEELKQNLHRTRVNHIITEIYNQTLAVARQQIVDAKKAHGNRIFSINVDNWKSKNSTRKFMGIRLYFNDAKMKFQNWMLSVREFNPSFQMRKGPTGLRRSMDVWAKAICLHYGIKFEDIFGATTDKAGDVRILNQLDIQANWDWCIPHLLNCVLYYAFGAKRNPWMHREIDEMKNAISSIRDLTKDGNLFEEILIEENPEAAKKLLQTHQEQRFMGVYLTCKRYYEMFETINETCLASGIVNKVKMTKPELKQLISVLQPLRDISRSAQTQQSAYGFRILQKLIHERLEGVMNAAKSVIAFDNKDEIISSLCGGVITTRKLIIDAIDLKFFKRYFQKTKVTSSGDVTVQAYLIECQHLLHPALRNLKPVMNVIEHMVRTGSVACESWTRKNKKLAGRHAQSLATRGLTNRPVDELAMEFFKKKRSEYILHVQNDIHDTVKNHIIDAIIESNPEAIDGNVSDVEVEVEPRQRSLQFASLEQYVTDQNEGAPESSTDGRRPVQSIVRRISHCMESYLKAKTSTHRAFQNQAVNCNLVEWKELHGSAFADVASAFAAYFGVPTSSAGVELDFYFASLLLVKQRMSMKGPLVEMMHMLDRNRQWVDLTQVDKLTALQALNVQPHFSGDDHVVYSDDEEDMGHADEEDGSSTVGNDDDYEEEDFNFDVEEKKRAQDEKKKKAERKKNHEEYLVAEQKAADEKIRYEIELERNLIAKQKLADQRKQEREKNEKRAKKKEAAKKAQEEVTQLESEVKQNELRLNILKVRVEKQKEEKREQQAAEKKEKEDDRLLQEAAIEKDRVDSSARNQEAEANKNEMERAHRKTVDDNEQVRSAEIGRAKRVAEQLAKDRAASMEMGEDAHEKKRLAQEKKDLEWKLQQEQFNEDECEDRSQKLKEEEEEKRLAALDAATAKAASEMEKQVKENENKNENFPSSRPPNRHSVKCDTDTSFFDDANYSRRKILKEKRELLKAQILDAGRRLDITTPLYREQESIENELNGSSKSIFNSSSEDDGEHGTTRRVVYHNAGNAYENSIEDEEMDFWNNDAEYKKL